MTLRRKDFLKRRGLLEEGNQWKKWKNNKACHIQPANKWSEVASLFAEPAITGKKLTLQEAAAQSMRSAGEYRNLEMEGKLDALVPRQHGKVPNGFFVGLTLLFTPCLCAAEVEKRKHLAQQHGILTTKEKQSNNQDKYNEFLELLGSTTQCAQVSQGQNQTGFLYIRLPAKEASQEW